MLASGGEDALQMKELAERAVVSLATLYRYFPSKDQREQRLTATLVRVLTDTRPEYVPVIAQTQQLHMRVIEHVAMAGGPVDNELRRRFLIVLDVLGAATGRWLAEMSSAAEARFEIRVGCYLREKDEEAA